MKINKLFHWLYAILMFLPIFAIGVTCGYTMFNDNAYQSFESDNLISTKSQVVEYSQLQDNTIYNFQYDETKENGYTGRFGFKNISFDLYSVFPNMVQRDYVAFLVYGNDQAIIWYFLDNGNLTSYYYGSFLSANITNFSITLDINYTQSTLVIHRWNVFTYTYKETTLSNVFYFSIDKVMDSDFFSWANTSFLVVPFQYIFNLFGIAANSPLMLLLSYWLSVSIIWLVFDLIMYVPLLAHRWIDKGMVD